MPLFQAEDKIFGNLAVPSDRCVAPLVGYGSNGANALMINSSYASFTPIYTNVPKVITTLQFIVTTAASATGTPSIQIAMYNCRPNQLAPSTRIENTFTTGIVATTTGVKTVTFSPTWVLPKGITFFSIHVKATSSNNTCNMRGFDGVGREGALLGSIGAGFDGTNPTNQFAQAGVPYIIIGENTDLSSDYSSTSITYNVTGTNRVDTSYAGVFLK